MGARAPRPRRRATIDVFGLVALAIFGLIAAVLLIRFTGLTGGALGETHAARTINDMYHGELTCDMDVVIAGAILADVGKLLEYVLDDKGKAIQGTYGKYLRHPFSGVSLAEECGVPPAVCHIIATHAGEGNMVKRTTEAYVVHHADFMTFLPFKERLIV